MQDIIYDVAVSADGFIAGVDDDISAFAATGAHVDDYFERLQSYSSAIMGRRTYEVGYQYGMVPGQNPYPHMRVLVVSRSLKLPENSAVEVVRSEARAAITELRKSATTPIYLCGGGAFAGWLLREGFINTLRLKRAPVWLGAGISLFGEHKTPVSMHCTQTKTYDNHVIYQEYALN